MQLALKYAPIVRGHYLFREANSFPEAKLEENFELRGTDNVQLAEGPPRDLQIMVCSCVVPSKRVLLQTIFCSCVIGTTFSRQEVIKYENKLGYRMIKQLLNSVITKYPDLPESRRLIICLGLRLRQIIELLATDKSRYFAQPRRIIVNYFKAKI